MKVERKDGSRERLILTSMVVSTPVLSKVAPKWDKRGMFKSKWSDTIGKWCVDYYDKYGKAPGKAVEGLFEAWAEDNNDKDAVKLVERFLQELSGGYAKKKAEVNVEYVSDVAADYFTKIRLSKLADVIQGEVDSGDVARALKAVRSFDDVGIDSGAGVDVLRDKDALKRAFESRQEPLIRLKGALGNFFGEELSRDSFVSFEGPEKRGKTYVIMELAWQAMLQGNKVAMFQVGDLSQDQTLKRFMRRAARRPFAATPSDDPVKWPTWIEHTPGDEARAEVTHEDRVYDRPMTLAQAERAFNKVVGKLHTDETRLRLFTYPNFSVSALGVKSVIQEHARRGWLADVVVIDYADILAPPTGEVSRDQINMNWMIMRQMSQKFHNLVITATQTKASSYEAETLDMTHFGEDKRKRAHVTGSVGINQNDEEKDVGVMRLNWIVRREEKFNKKRCVYCAGCLAAANPLILSTF